MKQIRVGIIGQGRSGRDIHAWTLVKFPEMYKIAAVAEPLEIRRKMAERDFGCETYPDYLSMIENTELDLVVNASPSHLHVPITLDLLNKGFNVLCEKPLASRVKDVDMLIEASKKSGKLLAIFQQSRFAPYYLQVKKVIDSGVLGRIVQISIAFNGFARRWDWQTIQEYNGGSLLNTGPHPLDQALQFLGTDVMPKVTCIMDKANSFGDAEDYMKLIMHVPGRPVIDLEISSCCAYPSFTYNVQGTCGGLTGTMSHMEWKYFKPSEAPERHLIRETLMGENGNPSYCWEELKWYTEKWDVPKEESNLMSIIAIRYYNMLYKTLTEGAPLEITPQEVRAQVAVIEECRRQNPLFGLTDFAEKGNAYCTEESNAS